MITVHPKVESNWEEKGKAEESIRPELLEINR
jgi:hypothetical protein